MTPKQQNKLKAIKSTLRQHIKEAEKATPGPWTWKTRYSGSAELDEPCIWLGESSSLPPKQPHLNAAFIASARTMSPLACRMALYAIETMEYDKQEGNAGAYNDLVSILSIWEGGQP